MEALLSQLLCFLLLIVGLTSADGSWISDNLQKFFVNHSNLLLSCGPVETCDLAKGEFCHEGLIPGRPMCRPCNEHCGKIHEDLPSEDCIKKCPVFLMMETLSDYELPTMTPEMEGPLVVTQKPQYTYNFWSGILPLICFIFLVFFIALTAVCVYCKIKRLLQKHYKGMMTPDSISSSLLDPESRCCFGTRRNHRDAQPQELQVLNECQPENDGGDGSGNQGEREPAPRGSSTYMYQLQNESHRNSTPQSKQQRLHSVSQGNSTGSLDQGQSIGSVSHQTSRSYSAQLQAEAEAQTQAKRRPDALPQISPVGSSTPIQSHLSHTLPKRQRLMQQDTFHASGDSSNLTTPLQLESNVHNLHQAQRTGSFHQPVSSHYAQTSDAITSPIQESNHLIDRPYNSDNVQ